MDLRIPRDRPTDRERTVIEAVVAPAETVEAGGRVVRGGHVARSKRHLLLPALAAVQSEIGRVSPGAMAELAARLMIPPAEIYGVATFYGLLSTGAGAGVVVHVCVDPICATGPGIVADLDARGIAWEESSCLGHCDRAPAVFVQRAGKPDLEVTDARPGLDVDPDSAVGVPPTHAHGDQLLRRVTSARSGRPGAVDLDRFRSEGGLAGLRRALRLGPEGTLEAIGDLRGRGGAAFPTAAKWRAVRGGEAPRHVVCNADESEPGSFKDRVLLEGDPLAVLEGLVVAGVTVGADRGFVYLRGEYPLAADRVAAAIAVSRDAGILGPDVLGSGLGFDVELRLGQGAYVCGEETALIASIEGRRGEPRNRPPFPTTRGLFGRPTVVNNVETLAAVAATLANGAPSGTKLLSVSGAVDRPGVYEVPLGTTLGMLLSMAGRPATLGPVLLGGAAGAFVDDLDLPLSFEAARERGLSLGSGAVMVFAAQDDMADVARRIAAFFRRETCGQCVPCRVGVVRQEEALERWLADGSNEAREALAELAEVMTDASICGLGQTASSAIGSAIRLGILGRRG